MSYSIESGETVEINLGNLHQRSTNESPLVDYINSNFDRNENHVLDDNDIDWKSHCHSNRTDLSQQQSNKKAFRQLIASTVLCFLFMTAEVIGGALANSLAIMTGMTIIKHSILC